MRNLDRFLDAAVELGVRFRQDFAPEFVPILDGRSCGRSIIFFRRLALKVRVKGEDANTIASAH
jgi:hypothetical protein